MCVHTHKSYYDNIALPKDIASVLPAREYGSERKEQPDIKREGASIYIHLEGNIFHLLVILMKKQVRITKEIFLKCFQRKYELNFQFFLQ